MTPAQLRLLNEFQRGFPLCRRPYLAIAERLGASEQWVIDALRGWQQAGTISRVGAVFAPGAIGASTLAALAVPADRLDAVAALISSQPEVNHNYEREHRYNLWFVLTAADDTALGRALGTIEAQADCGAVISLPLLEEYRIDLGFDLSAPGIARARQPAPRAALRADLTARDRRLILALEAGLALTPEPFAVLGEQAQLSESEAVQRIEAWIEAGVIRRFGVVVRHRELGYTANAMAVWDVPDTVVTAHGRLLAQQPGVNLCYRRRRAAPDWRYNLFCMVHGRTRETVLDCVEGAAVAAGIAGLPQQVLFSRARFKQRGARYLSAGAQPLPEQRLRA